MNGRESCTSLRSMEILSPEPPRELNIPVNSWSDEEAVKSSGDKKSKKSKKKKNSESSFQDEKLTRGLGIKLVALKFIARSFKRKYSRTIWHCWSCERVSLSYAKKQRRSEERMRKDSSSWDIYWAKRGSQFFKIFISTNIRIFNNWKMVLKREKRL